MRTMFLVLAAWCALAPSVSLGTVTGSRGAEDGWDELVALLETLPEDVDEETRRLVLDLLAEAGGFAAVSDSLPENALAAPESPRRFSLLTRAEGKEDARVFTRLRAELPGGFALGVAGERDPGEAGAFDHAAAGARWRADASWGVVEVILGDAVVEWGQRLLAGVPSFGVPGGPDARDRVRAYDGASESLARRGAAVRATAGRFDASCFAFRTRLDAGLDEHGDVTTLRTSGVHVTEGERSGMDAVGETAVGLRLTRREGAWRVGLSTVDMRYDRAFAPGDAERRRFGFEGDALRQYGVDLLLDTPALAGAAEIVTGPSGETAALVSLEGRPGRATVLLGAAAASRGFTSPLGADPPGASSGGNCVAAWLRLGYSQRGRWSGWCRGTLTGHPWRTYNDPLPPQTAALAAGGAVRLSTGTSLRGEVSVRDATGTSAAPHVSERTMDRRERVTLASDGSVRWRLWVAQTSRAVDGVESGRRGGVGCSVSVGVPERGRYDVGVTIASAEGSAPALYAWEPGLPGTFGLRTLKGSGAGWYIRATRTLPAGVRATIRATRPTDGEGLTLGLALEAGFDWR